MDWAKMAVVGRIARAHGIRGQVIVNLETDFPETRFRPGAELFTERGGVVDRVRVTTVRFQRDRPVIGIEGVNTMNDAEALAGCELRIPADQLAALPAGTFYRHDLVGCRVETRDGQPVGTVSGVEGDVARSRLVVDGARGEILIPLAADICTTIDVGGRRIVIEPPEGLLELNTPGGKA
jgi:16S rRNA processing protein RimM